MWHHFTGFPIANQRGKALLLAAFSGVLSLSMSGCFPPRNEAIPKSASSHTFVDVAASAGLNFKWSIEGKRPLNILQTIGNGCAFLDYNGDGNLDIFLVGSKLALYKGNGKGQFQEVTNQTNLANFEGKLLGCAVGDYDNDGFQDIYVSGYNEGLLLRNEKGQGFREVSKTAGLKKQAWGTSCAFAQLNPKSPYLDLYVANYAVFNSKSKQLCLENGKLTSCGPRHYDPLRGVLYQNLGGGRFQDVTVVQGLHKGFGKTLGVAIADIDGSGHQSIALANDETFGDLFKPIKGKQSYKNIAQIAGTATDRDGNVHGGMGTDWGDYDNDGKFDLVVMTFQNEAKSLYQNQGNALFFDMGIPTQLSASTAPYVAFGCKFFDFDNDGWLDLVIANGHVQDNISELIPNTEYRQQTQLFRNSGSSPITFQEVKSELSPDAQRPIVGRGLAVGDYDNDGKLDVLVVDSEGKPLLLHNVKTKSGNWIGIKLVGTKCNRDGYGAILTLKTQGRTLVRRCHADGSYLSSSDPRVHFGLGQATQIDELTIRWTDGQLETHTNLPINRYITLVQGEKAPTR